MEHVTMANLLLGRLIAMSLQRPDKALECFERARQLATERLPDEPAAHQAKAEVCCALADYYLKIGDHWSATVVRRDIAFPFHSRHSQRKTRNRNNRRVSI